jgi:hypothetical protein
LISEQSLLGIGIVQDGRIDYANEIYSKMTGPWRRSMDGNRTGTPGPCTRTIVRLLWINPEKNRQVKRMLLQIIGSGDLQKRKKFSDVISIQEL